MKKLLSIILVLLLFALPSALCAPRLSDRLLDSAKQAAGCLASGEYERLVTLLPFSGTAPSAAEWERFARSYASPSAASGSTAVAFFQGGSWRVAVPMGSSDSADTEALLLQSEDGASFTGYKYATWAQVQKALKSAEDVIWG